MYVVLWRRKKKVILFPFGGYFFLYSKNGEEISHEEIYCFNTHIKIIY